MLQLQRNLFNFVCVPGIQMHIADALSGAPVVVEQKTVKYMYTSHLVKSVPSISEQAHTQFRQTYKHDEEIQTLTTMIVLD